MDCISMKMKWNAWKLEIVQVHVLLESSLAFYCLFLLLAVAFVVLDEMECMEIMFGNVLVIIEIVIGALFIICACCCIFCFCCAGYKLFQN